MHAEQPRRTNDVSIVSAGDAPCICSPISYRELWILLKLQIIDTCPASSALTSNPSDEYTPSQSCLIHKDLAYCILTIGLSFHELPPEIISPYSQHKTNEKCTFFICLFPLLLLATSLTGRRSCRVSLSSRLSNAAHHTWMIWVSL